MTCFIYDKRQVPIIELKYTEKYGKVLRYEERENYTALYPDGKAVKHLIY